MRTSGPVAVYLSELSEGSRRTMTRPLATACSFFGGSDPRSFPWHKVRVDQVARRCGRTWPGGTRPTPRTRF